jgi:Glycosyl transferase family 2
MTRLSVIVPATNRPPTLSACLAAVAEANPDEVIVVDEAARPGPAAARNEGVTRSTGEIVVFVDADVLIHPDALERIREAFAHDNDLVAVFGSYDDTVATHGEVAAFRNLLHHTVHQRSQGTVETFWAGLGAVRRAVFDAVGGFDADRYPEPSIEDIELGGRLARLGPIRLDGAIQGTHLKEWTLASMVTTDFARRGVPWVSLMYDHGEVPRTLNLGMRERASVVATLATTYAIARRRPKLAALTIAGQVALNHDLFANLIRARGVRGLLLGMPLHTLHQLTGAVAIPFGVRASRRSRSRSTI